MAQHYSHPKRETDPHSLPDVETFRIPYAYCHDCGSLMQDEDAKGDVHCLDCATSQRPTAHGWFYWFCFPGCLPESDPFGPFETETAALQDARETAGDDDVEDDDDVYGEDHDDQQNRQRYGRCTRCSCDLHADGTCPEGCTQTTEGSNDE